MAEVLNVRIQGEMEEFTITDSVPLESAARFKEVSDAIWALKPESNRLSYHGLLSRQGALEVRERINSIVGKVDERFVVSGIGKVLDLGKSRPEEEPVIIPATVMDAPNGTEVGTFNWDNYDNYRIVDVDGERKVLEFTDGHRDYAREICLKLNLGREAVATYAIQRYQTGQDQTANMSLFVWHSEFAETGYEGHQIAYADVTEEQENRFLDLVKIMADIK